MKLKKNADLFTLESCWINCKNMDEVLCLPSNQKDTVLHVTGVNRSQSEVVQKLWVSLTLSELKTSKEITLKISALKTQ